MRYKKNKEQLKHLKEVVNKLGLSSCSINKYWKKEWAPFIKHDFDWDSRYFLDILIYKIEKIKTLKIMLGMKDLQQINS